MSMDSHVLVDHRTDGVLSIMLARPERRNAITVAMYAALANAIESAADNATVRLITIEGQGEDFTAGNDLGDFLQAMPDPGSGEDIPVWRLLRALARNQVPIVAAVHGNAVGIGTTMLFHCDFVLAEEGCRFVMPFVDLGLVPEAASSRDVASAPSITAAHAPTAETARNTTGRCGSTRRRASMPAPTASAPITPMLRT